MALETLGMEMREMVINPFSMHLSDAILAAHLAATAETRGEIKAMHSRTAVAHSAFALECAANSFVARLPRNHQFREQAEMWSILDKFDLFLLSLPGNPRLPRDEQRVADIQDLIKFRDKHVHSRSVRMQVSKPMDPNASFKLDWPLPHSSEIKPASFIWDADDARKAIEVTLHFLQLVLGLARFTPDQITATLFSYVVCADGNRRIETGNFDRILKLADTINLDISFLISILEKDSPVTKTD